MVSPKLSFPPGAKFFVDEDGCPVSVEGGKPFLVGPRGKVASPSPAPSLEDVGVRELSESEFVDFVRDRRS
jgi:hypothetical protein